MPSRGVSTIQSLPLQLARWFEARINASLSPPSALLRLYGLDVVDPAGLDGLDPAAARVSFLAEAPSMDMLAALPAAHSVHDHDASAMVSTRWLPSPWAEPLRPGEFPRRRRARLVHVVTDQGVACVARFDDVPELVVLSPAA